MPAFRKSLRSGSADTAMKWSWSTSARAPSSRGSSAIWKERSSCRWTSFGCGWTSSRRQAHRPHLPDREAVGDGSDPPPQGRSPPRGQPCRRHGPLAQARAPELSTKAGPASPTETAGTRASAAGARGAGECPDADREPGNLAQEADDELGRPGERGQDPMISNHATTKATTADVRPRNLPGEQRQEPENGQRHVRWRRAGCTGTLLERQQREPGPSFGGRPALRSSARGPCEPEQPER